LRRSALSFLSRFLFRFLVFAILPELEGKLIFSRVFYIPTILIFLVALSPRHFLWCVACFFWPFCLGEDKKVVVFARDP